MCVHSEASRMYAGILEADENVMSYEACRFVSADRLKAMGKTEVPAVFIRVRERRTTDGQKKRLTLIQPLLTNDSYIDNKEARKDKIREIARENQTTERWIQRLYYQCLAGVFWWGEGTC